MSQGVLERDCLIVERGPSSEPTVVTLNDALPIAVLSRLMSDSAADKPTLPLYRVRGMGEAHQFASLCFDSRRTRQIVMMTSSSQDGWRLSPLEVAAAVGEHADVVMLGDGHTIYAAANALTKALSTYSGGIRVLRPGMAIDDDKDIHPLVRTFDDPGSAQRSQAMVERHVREGLTMTRHSGAAPQVTEADIAQAVLDAVRKERAKTNEVEAKLKAATRALAKAESALADEARPVFADPHAQFRFELHHAWLQATEEGDRQNWPLREWELGPGFLDSIPAQQIVDRPRVIRACVDVITGRHAEINSRASHVLRTTGAAGNAPARRRETDGATAWRCAVNTGPAAARLMWWERPDSVVELSLIAAHDDIRII